MIALEDELYDEHECGQVVIIRKKGGARVTGPGGGGKESEGYYRVSCIVEG